MGFDIFSKNKTVGETAKSWGDKATQEILPRTATGRFMLAILSIPFIVISGYPLWFLATTPLPPNAKKFAIAICCQFLSVLFGTSLMGLIWSIATPRWLERKLE